VHDEAAYQRGWLAGMADGDGCFWTLKFRRGYRRFRLALNDNTLLDRAQVFAATAGVTLRRGTHSAIGFNERLHTMNALWLTSDSEARAFEAWLDADSEDPSWCAGYLGGILDAEGSHSAGILRIAQFACNADTRLRIERVLHVLEIPFTREEQGFYVRKAAGGGLRALSLAQPRRESLRAGAIGHHPHASRTISTVEPTHQLEEVVTLTTTLGSFVAAGFVVKNCDTKYTWDWENHDRDSQTIALSNEDVVRRVTEAAQPGCRNIVITGGEPLLQQAHLVDIARELKRLGYRIEIETSGTIEPLADLATHVDQWNVSPKLSNSGNKLSARLRTGPLTWFAACDRAQFKFVIATKEEVAEVLDISNRFGIARDRITIMPEGTDAETLTSRALWLVECAREAGLRFGTRLHVYIWGAERGR
jgi:organic radical activating enzyme